MINIVKYLGCDKKDEFEYYFEIKGQKVIVFNMFGQPYRLIPGEHYSIKFYLFWIDECQLESVNEIKYSIEKASSPYYVYYLHGKLKGNKLDLNGFVVEDKAFANYKKFKDKFVKVKIDRIDIRVLNMCG